MLCHRRLALAVATVSLGLVAGTVPATSQASPAWRSHATTSASPMPRVHDLRYAEHPGYDRVVIDLTGHSPGYRVRYAAGVRYAGSGRHVPIRGQQYVTLTLTRTSGHRPDGTRTYAGRRIARPHFDTLRAVAMTGDYEGRVTFGFALNRRAPYRIFRLHHPQRIVLDFRR